MPERRTLAEIPGVREEIERSTGRRIPAELWALIGGATPAEATAWLGDITALMRGIRAEFERFLATHPPPPPT